ncbi:hypothetical protein LEP1GSC058_1937 [Leptospira fainei serovar Hurstbridge str. BUT 6]|uniref:Uncharacterized protein n=1 Tax=Leptospira fainei serovar Hurstbridge str. BUT 6 TaxID=1193011 RepID=S3W681_9LEPT|nr:hypothetical protein LEP1GSC058_1937 [Leptospira fainei serovar Hurstbridge str. BUT 6]
MLKRTALFFCTVGEINLSRALIFELLKAFSGTSDRQRYD